MGWRDGTADNCLLTSYRYARLSIQRYISFVNYAMLRMRCYFNDSLVRLAIIGLLRGELVMCASGYGVKGEKKLTEVRYKHA
jgi:hypothetical protein